MRTRTTNVDGKIAISQWKPYSLYFVRAAALAAHHWTVSCLCRRHVEETSANKVTDDMAAPPSRPLNVPSYMRVIGAARQGTFLLQSDHLVGANRTGCAVLHYFVYMQPRCKLFIRRNLGSR